MNQQVRSPLRSLLVVPIVVGCLVYLVKLDPRLWVSMTAVACALVLRSSVVIWRRATGRKRLDLIGTMCLSFIGAAVVMLVIALVDTHPGVAGVLFIGYLSALVYGTAAEIVALALTWALPSAREPSEDNADN